MKHSITLTLLTALMAATLLASCKSAQSTVKTTPSKTTTSTASTSAVSMLNTVTANTQTSQYVTSKIKFKVQMDDKSVTLGGKLLMKRDDVIRLQLTALGLFEAARIEFTKDYVLVMDRMNKQYIKVDYSQVDFLRQSGLNFYSLQALFWNELFLPNHTTRVASADANQFNIATASNNNITLKISKDKLNYTWTANQQNGQISKFAGSYVGSQTDKVGVSWDYSDFKAFGTKKFPTDNAINVVTPKKKISADLQLNSISNDSDWETRTEVSSKFKQVKLEDIMKKISSL